VSSLVLAAACWALGELAVDIQTHRDIGSLLWSPVGIGLAAIVLWGRRMWLAIAIGTFIPVLSRAPSLLPAVLITTNHVCEVLLGAWLLRRLGVSGQLARVRDVVRFLVVCTTVTALSTCVSVAEIYGLFGSWKGRALSAVWPTWWWGHLSADLVVTPAILTWVSRSPLPPVMRPRVRFEVAALASTTLAMVIVLLGLWLPPWFPAPNAPYYLLPLLLWAGVRFGPRGAAAASYGASMSAIIAHSLGAGPFYQLSELHTFVAVSTVGTLLLSALAVSGERSLATAWVHELEHRETLMRQAEALAHLGSFDFDLEGDKLEWSDELFRIYGADPGSFRPTYLAFLHSVHPDDRIMVETTIASAIRAIGPFALELRVVRDDGSTRDIRLRGRVFPDEHGQPYRVIGCCQDVTETKRAEATRARLAAIVEASEDAIVGLAPDGTIETWNPAAARLLGYSEPEALGRPCQDLVPDDMREELGRILEKVRSGTHVSHYELVHRRRDETVFVASVTMFAVLDSRGRVSSIGKIMRDITPQKIAEDSLRESLVEKEVLLREIHHRVKNNLQVVSSLLNIQVETEPSEAARRGLLESQRRVQSMALVHQLLYRSHDLGSIDIAEYLSTLVDQLADTYRRGLGTIDINVETPPIRLDVDHAIPCGLIVNELVTNALVHAFPDNRSGTIAVKVGYTNGVLELEVRDSGVGLPANFRLDESHTFGLQIARTLALQLDGTMELTTDAGTCVRITFPLETPALAAA
jgi:PAS domain S-box-containing protein